MLRAITNLLPWSQPTEGSGTPPTIDRVPYDNVTPWKATSNVQSFSGSTCEICGTKGVPVVYGYLTIVPPEDEAVVGGCTISPGMPRYACTNCKTRWNAGDEDYYETFRKLLAR